MLQHDPCIVKLQVGSFNEVLGIFIDSWSALDSGERDKYSQEATQPPPPTDFHRQRLFILRPVSAVFCFLREGFGGSRTTSPDLVVGRCGMHIRALPGAPKFGVATGLI